MRTRVCGGLARRREGLIEIVEGAKRDGAKYGELEGARRAFDVGARAAEARRGMSEEGKKGARRKLDRGFKDQPGERARGALPQRAPGRILDLDAPSRKLRGNPARDGRIGRDEGCGLARRFERFAHGDRQRQGLFVLVVGDDDRNALERGGDRGRRQRALAIAPAVGRFGGTERLAHEGRARRKRKRGRAEGRHVLASDADHADQPVQQRLRMPREPLRLVACADHRPRAVVEIEVEVRQNDRALGAARNRRNEAGGRAIGACRAGDDRRAAPRSALHRLDFVLDQKRDPLRPVDQAALGEPFRPMREGDLEKVEGDAPIGVIKIGGKRLELRPRRALDDHIVDQRGKIARKRIGLGGSRRDERRLGRIDDEPPIGVNLADCAAERPSPGAREASERMTTRQRSDRGRQGGAGGLLLLSFEERRRFVRLESAERSDARQEQAPGPACREQRLRQRLSGALRRHVDGRVRQRHCAARAGEAVDQDAIEQGAAQNRQERRPGGNREDSGLAKRHARLLCGARGKASGAFS